MTDPIQIMDEIERLCQTDVNEWTVEADHMQSLRTAIEAQAEELAQVAREALQYVIRNGDAERYNDVEYWNNNMGWVEEREDASRFTQDERDTLNLPMGGYWERV